MKNIYHRTECRLCGSKKLKKTIPLEKIPLTEKYITEDQLNSTYDLYPIDVYMCLDCSHVQILDCIDADILWDDFTFRSGQAKIIIDHLNDVAQKTCKKYKIPKNSFVMDIGSNDGTLLKGYKDQGMKVLGVDPAKEIASEANKANIPTISEFLTETTVDKIIKKHGKALIVNCFNAFAHVDDMNELMASISKMVDSNGIFIFEVSYLVDIIDNLLLGTIIHEHLCHHSVIPLVKFLKKFGMELIDVERVPYQGGSIIGISQHIGGPFPVNQSVNKMIDYEKKYKFNLPGTIETFSIRLNKLIKEFSKLISEWKSKGEIIAGYGAARSGPTLISQFKIGDKISFIVDDHPQKVNRYTPGDNIKILPTKELLLRMPKYTLIFAWVHTETIIKNNHEYLINGGNFVIIFPEIKIVSAKDLVK